MKTKNHYLWLFLIAILSTACEKENVTTAASNSTTQPTENEFNRTGAIIGDYEANMRNCVDNDEVTYYVNNEEVRPGTFDPDNEDLYILIDGDQETVDGVDELRAVRIRAFTTLEEYYAFGDANDIPLRAYDEFERTISAYIAESRIGESYDAGSTVPDSYYGYQNTLANRYFPGAADDRTPIVLYKDYVGGSSWVHGGFSPFLAPGYNNKASRYNFLGIYGVQVFYDKTFYRRKMATIWGWGWQIRWFHPSWGLGFLNDRVSSLIAI